jgi:hypothetical protein
VSKPQLKIGDSVWIFDSNHRVYPKPEPGHSYAGGGPIYREHWRERFIIGETSRSWLIGYRRDGTPVHSRIKVAKTLPGSIHCSGRGYGPSKIAYSWTEVEADVWAHGHRYPIVRMVERCDGETLKQVAALIGYEGGRAGSEPRD